MSKKKLPQEPFYSDIVNIRNTELTVYWTRYNIQAAINIGLLAVTISANPGSYISQFRVQVSILGILISCIWIGFIVLSKKLIHMWEEYIIKYENEYLYDKIPMKPIKVFTDVYEKNRLNKTNKSIISWIIIRWKFLDIFASGIPIICILTWLFILIK
ncbi:MAG: hypothetical protein ACFFDN_38205 [Candidatus Hodarchaeota archaeon]